LFADIKSKINIFENVQPLSVFTTVDVHDDADCRNTECTRDRQSDDYVYV